jgi:HEAT repeat protein
MSSSGQLQKYVSALNSDDKNIRQEAIRSLKQCEEGTWAAVPQEIIRPLVKALRQVLSKNSTDSAMRLLPNFRQDAVTILGNIGPRAEAAVPQLLELLAEGGAANLREAAVTALGRIGTGAAAAVEPLLALLNPGCRATFAARVARTLGEIGCADQKVRVALVNLWLFAIQIPESRVQVGIALCKLRLDAPGLLPTLTSILVMHRSAPLRKAAAEALGWCSKNDRDAVPALMAALSDDDEDVCRIAEAGLTHMHLTVKQAIHLCAKHLKESTHAERALVKSGQPAVASLIAALGSEEAVAREKAARSLGGIGEAAAAAAPALTKALRDRHKEVRLEAAKALWNITNEADAVVRVLAELLMTKWSPLPEAIELRRRFLQTVIEALSRIGARAQAAVPALLEKAKDDNRLIRESALRTLADIGPLSPPVAKKVAALSAV